MAKISDAFPSKYLSAQDLNGRDVTVTISRATIETIGQGHDAERKIVLSFVGKQKQLVCNKTNAKTIAGLYGDETDFWVGKPIILSPREVEYQGNMVLAIRVSLKMPQVGQQAQPQPQRQAQPAPQPVQQPAAQEVQDEDIPF